ncbi:hypothetical protein [Novosphingobium sp.]|uniref:hypothetical protein n=1 Tax=Novosphingobium sp. TaxID=1874826 RepID=UPI0027332DB8|nr:hypothetical protein [Novosphingobium sp.]MDP3905671.1 hypothetical protein [Novosphingobium sp.]
MKPASLVLLSALLPVAAAAATPPAPEDNYDRLGMAVALENTCSMMRGFEGWFMHKAWTAQMSGSNVDGEIEAARRAAGGLGDITASAEAGEKARAAAHKRFADKARTLGCQGGMAYLRDGKMAAATMFGSTMLTAQQNRSSAPPATGLTVLTAEQRGLHSAFVAVAQADFGVNLPLLEQQMGKLAQQRMGQYRAQQPVMAATLQVRDHDEAFGLLRLESQAQGAGYQPRLVALNRFAPLDLPVLEWRKAGSAPVRFAQVPARLRLADAGVLKWQAYAVLAVCQGGGATLGLFGEDAPALAGRFQARFINDGANTAVDLARQSADCLFDACFSVPDALLGNVRAAKAMVVVTLEQPVKSYADESNVMRIDLATLPTVMKP